MEILKVYYENQEKCYHLTEKVLKNLYKTICYVDDYNIRGNSVYYQFFSLLERESQEIRSTLDGDVLLFIEERRICIGDTNIPFNMVSQMSLYSFLETYKEKM